VLAIFGEPRRMAAITELDIIVRGAHRTAQVRCREGAHIRMTMPKLRC
jgi:hypothetical protein